jgi:hypothetical protein
MITLSQEMLPILLAFTPQFSKPVFRHVQVLVVGSLLTPGVRTVCAALRVMGLSGERQFQTYHRVLNRDRWSSRKVAQTLFGLLVKTFVPSGSVVIGLDDTLERRRGPKIAAKGIYRDPVRSSHNFFVKASGLRWVVMSLLSEVPFAGRVWALPFLSVLAPSERYHKERGQRHKTLTEWAGQMIAQVRRWLPDRLLVIVSDRSYAALELLDRCRHLSATMITRLRLDAGLYEPPPERTSGTFGRPRRKGNRLPTLQERLTDPRTEWKCMTVSRWYGEGEREIEIASETAVWYHTGQPVVPIRWVLIRPVPGCGKPFDPQALLCTDLGTDPLQIVSWFVLRWQVEVTFEETRAHLGLETQRQWNNLAIARTTPAILGLFSLVALLANEPSLRKAGLIRQAAWYVKDRPTFSDALAWVRYHLWTHGGFCTLNDRPDDPKLGRALTERLTQTLCYAA